MDIYSVKQRRCNQTFGTNWKSIVNNADIEKAETMFEKRVKQLKERKGDESKKLTFIVGLFYGEQLIRKEEIYGKLSSMS